jgi:aminoglycoside phosphotransferase
VSIVADLVAASGADATNTPGAVPATSIEYRFDPERTAAMLGQSLAALHRLAVPEGAEELSARSVLDERKAHPLQAEDLDGAYSHMTPKRLLEILEETLPVGPPPKVLTHGDASLLTLRCHDGRAVGFADWSEAAVGDPHRDLASAATSVAAHLGPMAVPLMFTAYGRDPEPRRLEWWTLALQLGPK